MQKFFLFISILYLGCNTVTPESEIVQYFALGVKYDSLENQDSSIYYYSKIIRLDSTNHPAWYFRGRDYLLQAKFEDGIYDLNKAIALHPSPQYYTDRGFAYNNIFEYEAGEEDFIQALKLDPKHVEAYYGLSMVNAGMGKYHKALQYCNMADAMEYNKKYSLAIRAQSYCGIGKYEEAIEIIKKLISGERNSHLIGSYYNTMGFAENKLGEYQKALQHFSLSLGLNADNPYAYNNIAYALLKTGKIKEAMPMVEKSFNLYGENPYAYDTRGQIYLAMNQKNKACEDFSNATKFAVDSILINELNGLIKSHCKK